MNARFRWTPGTVLFLYFCGALLGANLIALVDALSTGATLIGPLLGDIVGSHGAYAGHRPCTRAQGEYQQQQNETMRFQCRQFH